LESGLAGEPKAPTRAFEAMNLQDMTYEAIIADRRKSSSATTKGKSLPTFPLTGIY
jgi:hypothetical protein